MWRVVSSRTRWFLLFCFFVIILCFIMLKTNKKKTREKLKVIHWPLIEENKTCFYKETGDVLPSAEDPNFSPGEKAIFFHETSCRGGINSRQACAVESAARMHPEWQINLLFTSPVQEFIFKRSNIAKLLEFQNVKVARIHVEEYSKGSIVEDILMKSIKNSDYPVEHLADILRILTLHKFGGVTLDTDIIVARSFDSLPSNWIAKEIDLQIATGAIALAKDVVGANLTTAILTEIRDTYNALSWNYNGPAAIHRVLNRTCPNVIKTDGNCEGLQIISREYFYPVHYSVFKLYFNRETLFVKQLPYMYHMWNRLSKKLPIVWDSVYAKLARIYCPSVYKMYGDDFGA